LTLSSDQFGGIYEYETASAIVGAKGYVRNLRAGERGMGHGTGLMQKIVSDADASGVELSLHARPDLHEWYGRFGFRHREDDIIGPVLHRPLT